MDHESNSWNIDRVSTFPHLFGGLMLTAALLGLSTGYFGGAGLTSLPHVLSNTGIFHKKKREKKAVRVYMDGCFDLMHYGHANALRQAKSLGDILVVGVVSDEEIIANKGPPVLPMEERLALVKGLKWVDEVIVNAPYAITEQFMKTLFERHKIDFIIHGDDPCILPDGSDAYALAKQAGRYKQIKRTEGVSSTDILSRMLRSMKDAKGSENHQDFLVSPKSDFPHNEQDNTHSSKFLPTSRRIVQFANGKGPGPNARVVYIDGAFDLFHAGHVEILRCARQLGDFVLVGVHTDQIVSEHRGKQFPVMNLHERSLSVLACRHVDEVIIGAPWQVSEDMITTFNISIVVHGTVAEKNPFLTNEADPYEIPKSLGIFRTIESPKSITTSTVAQRIHLNYEAFMKRNSKKSESEKKYYQEKVYVSGD